MFTRELNSDGIYEIKTDDIKSLTSEDRLSLIFIIANEGAIIFKQFGLLEKMDDMKQIWELSYKSNRL